MIRPMIWLVESSAARTIGARGEFGHHPADHDLQPDHPGDRGEHALHPALPRPLGRGGDQPVHEGEEGEVARALGELGEQAVGADAGRGRSPRPRSPRRR